MDYVFHDMIGRNVEVYVDDIVVKSDSCEQHISDLKEVFQAFRKYCLRLNLEKCVFGVEGGKFLGFMLTHWSIEANPEKCKAITEMRSPSGLKEIQRMIGRLTSLFRFVPKLAERTRPIIKLLKKTTKFEWTDECEQNFLQLKAFMASPPVIQKSNTREPIIVYLVVTTEAISSVLVQEIGAEERPVYFVSRVLHDAEVRYQMVEKVALALVITARRLRLYFQNHRVIVKTNYPIMKILTKPDLAGRMIGWAIELSEFHIEYQPRGAIKCQALVDFAAKLTPYPTEEEESRWTLYVDGSSNNRSCGAGVVLEGSREIVIEQAMKFEFKTSNNQAEYEAIIVGLHLEIELEITTLICKSDSRL